MAWISRSQISQFVGTLNPTPDTQQIFTWWPLHVRGIYCYFDTIEIYGQRTYQGSVGGCVGNFSISSVHQFSKQ